MFFLCVFKKNYPIGTFFFKVKKQYFRQRLLDLKPQDITFFAYKVF